MPGVFKSINLTLSFLPELALVIAVAYWGFSLPVPLLGRIVVGLALPIGVITLWAAFLAPRAKRRVPDLWKPVLVFALYAGATALLTTAGHPTIGSVFVIVAALNTIGLYALRRYSSPLDPGPDARSR